MCAARRAAQSTRTRSIAPFIAARRSSSSTDSSASSSSAVIGRLGSALVSLAISNGVVMAWRQRHLGTPWTLVMGFPVVTTTSGAASIASYLHIIRVWDQGPIAPAAALRDTSAVFALLIAVFWLKEPFDRFRVASVLLAAAAVPLLRFG